MSVETSRNQEFTLSRRSIFGAYLPGLNMMSSQAEAKTAKTIRQKYVPPVDRQLLSFNLSQVLNAAEKLGNSKQDAESILELSSGVQGIAGHYQRLRLAGAVDMLIKLALQESLGIVDSNDIARSQQAFEARQVHTVLYCLANNFTKIIQHKVNSLRRPEILVEINSDIDILNRLGRLSRLAASKTSLIRGQYYESIVITLPMLTSNIGLPLAVQNLM